MLLVLHLHYSLWTVLIGLLCQLTKLMVRPFLHMDTLFLGPFRLSQMICRCICQSLTLSVLITICCEFMFTHYLYYTFIVSFWVEFFFSEDILQELCTHFIMIWIYLKLKKSIIYKTVTYFLASHLLCSQYLSFPCIIGIT